MCLLSLVVSPEVPGKALLGMELNGHSRNRGQAVESPERQIPGAVEKMGSSPQTPYRASKQRYSHCKGATKDKT